MIYEITIPQADANMIEATLSTWQVAEGDTLSKEDVLVEMQTDKATFEIESPADTTLRCIVAPAKSVLPPGYIIAILGDAGDELPDYELKNKMLLQKNDPFASLETSSQKKEKSESPRRTARVRATPAARRLAKEQGIDLAEVKTVMGVDVINEEILKGYLDGL